jgi:phosphoribosylaminoimidazolecarboxamide formyltransferase/IMP cyclohydrolase
MSINRVEKIDDLVAVRNVLMSVSDKKGLDVLVPGLLEVCPDVRILSTGGTYDAVRKIFEGLASAGGAPVVPPSTEDSWMKHLMQVSEYTGQPETQGGLVKTLDFKIYLGLLTETYKPAHQQDLARTNAVPIDLVVVNLYPFTSTVAKAGTDSEDWRGNIDIGGPCMIRAAAKNWHRVAVMTNPSDYAAFLAALRENGGHTTLKDRYDLSRKAFRHTADYDTGIANHLETVPFGSAVTGAYKEIANEGE